MTKGGMLLRDEFTSPQLHRSGLLCRFQFVEDARRHYWLFCDADPSVEKGKTAELPLRKFLRQAGHLVS